MGSKKNGAFPAAELYISPWFRKVRALVESTGDPWFILSAQYGLIAPDKVIPPYDRTLNTMKAAERRHWAVQVQDQMDVELPETDEILVFAGVRYREYLLPFLESRFSKVTVPMAGLAIGWQLNWLDNAKTL